jgi:hypothetical protein
LEQIGKEAITNLVKSVKLGMIVDNNDSLSNELIMAELSEEANTFQVFSK